MGATVTGLAELEADLRRARDEAMDGAQKVVGQGCNNIKKQAQGIIRAAGHKGYLPHYPRSISYEVTAQGTTAFGECGPVVEKLQGGLGGLIENGSVNNAAIPHMSPSLDAEEPRFAKFLEELGVRLLEGQSIPGGPVVDPGGG